MDMKKTDTTIVLLISMLFLTQMLATALAQQTVEDRVAALEERVEALETELESVRVISFSLAFLALAIAVMIPIYPKFKQPAKK